MIFKVLYVELEMKITKLFKLTNNAENVPPHPNSECVSLYHYSVNECQNSVTDTFNTRNAE